MIDQEMKDVVTPLSIDQIKKMPPQRRKEHIRAYLKKVLKKNPNGVTVPFLMEITKLDRRTLREHLEYLTAVREAYKRDLGTIVYYPNSRVTHPSSQINVKLGDKYYSFNYIENPFGEFLYIQEKGKDEYNIFTIKGGIVVQLEYVDDLIELLKKTSEEFKRRRE